MLSLTFWSKLQLVEEGRPGTHRKSHFIFLSLLANGNFCWRRFRLFLFLNFRLWWTFRWVKIKYLLYLQANFSSLLNWHHLRYWCSRLVIFNVILITFFTLLFCQLFDRLYWLKSRYFSLSFQENLKLSLGFCCFDFSQWFIIWFRIYSLWAASFLFKIRSRHIFIKYGIFKLFFFWSIRTDLLRSIVILILDMSLISWSNRFFLFLLRFFSFSGFILKSK